MIYVDSEIKTLKTVLLHRPNKELQILNNDNKEHYLFDELPNVEIMQKEHDTFSNALKENGINVLYLEDLMAEVLDKESIKEEFIKEYLYDQDCKDESIYNELLAIKDNKELVLKTMSGLDGRLESMPNLYFTRDPFTIIGDGIALYHMHTKVRDREVIYGKYINKYHKDFGLPVYYDRNEKYEIEGGDVMLLSDDTIAIGQSERTSFNAINKLASNILSKDSKIKRILVMEIPSKRACMHLDTVFTRFDDNKFVIYEETYKTLKMKIIGREATTNVSKSLVDTLSFILNRNDIELTICKEEIEQWNDACNTLCLSPNKFVVYDINNNTNSKYINNNSSLIYLPSKELIKGRGGAHCMSMPLEREK